MARNEQSEWPTIKREPVGRFQTADVIQKSDRSLGGPLRMGTAPGVGPRGALRSGSTSDFEMDRVSPRRFDPIGNTNTFEPKFPESSLVSRDIRRRKR